MVDRSLLVFGQFKKRERIELSVMAEQAALSLELVDSAEQALRFLETKTPHAMLVDDSCADTESLCLQTRAHATQARTPIISLARELDDLSFAEVFNWGGDDAVRLAEMRAVLSRVRGLPREEHDAPESSRGVAVVADADRSRRVIRARALNNAGFAIRFALTAQDALAFASAPETSLVVLDADLDDALSSVKISAEQNPRLTHVFLCAPRHMSELVGALSPFSNVGLADGFAPPENVVFLANELSRGGVSENRRNRRLLYGTRVGFRGEGRDADDFGFTYNVSAGGLYVRTLAPPTDALVWIELRPPGTERWARLEGEVVWRRAFGRADNATVPPGFGVKLGDATQRNMDAWLAGCREFERALGFST